MARALSAPGDAVVHNYESSFVRVLYRDACARRARRQVPLHVQLRQRAVAHGRKGRREARPDVHAAADARGRPREFSFAARSCVPPAPTLPGIHWGDAAAAFFGRMERSSFIGLLLPRGDARSREGVIMLSFVLTTRRAEAEASYVLGGSRAPRAPPGPPVRLR